MKDLNNKELKKNYEMRHFLKKLLIIPLLSLLLFADINSQSIGRVGTTAAPFLKIGVGGRALGMGEAYTTLAEDVTGLFWNPAGIANIDKMQVLFNHFDYIADIDYEFGGIALPLQGVGTIGVFFSYLGMPDIERTTINSPNGNGERVGANSFVAGVSYARALTDRFSIGGSMKYIQETIWHSSAVGFGFDIGLHYRTFFKNVKIGMSISNFGSSMKMEGRDVLVQHDINDIFAGNNENINADLETEEYPLPILFRVGISSNITKDFLELENYDWIISVDAIHPNDNKEYMNMGTEINFYDMVSLRAGFRQAFLDNAEGNLALGFGIHTEVMGFDFKLDYANIDYGRLDHQNKFSLIFSF
ncbi:MAG: PorV/PorQ family protein [Melioribacteraceae bacterium]|nr:PorV/PorQ family protein [Melioribacteraceae bacterium]MCF8265206.1 PorV/PorQ family protein [Melioribacteraceae bacterium]MCF8413105.1 PorV/PorQ family protein [Melioribacteraceae bacterium]MCF8432613.1 PorV/PorQ family protein [Melioribacteraceae bacterium]